MRYQPVPSTAIPVAICDVRNKCRYSIVTPLYRALSHLTTPKLTQADSAFLWGFPSGLSEIDHQFEEGSRYSS